MMRTFAVVVAGGGSGVFEAASAALRRGQAALVLLRSSDARVARRLRDVALDSGYACAVEAGVEVLCVDGVGGVEAVVYRHRRTGRVDAVNASTLIAVPASRAITPVA